MTPQQKNRQFSKLLSYVLERHPEEFGLIPDESGYVKIKELLKAVNETEGWRHIRESNINELLLVETNPPFEIAGKHIRAKQRQQLPETAICRELPKILYTCVRKKAYPNVLEKGVSGQTPVICTPDSKMALRLGKRKDPSPVLLTIHTAKTAAEGVVFHQFTDMFFMADDIPPETFTGPPLPKVPEKEKTSRPAKPAKPRKDPGAFSLTPEMVDAAVNKKPKGKKKKLDWKQDRKRQKKKDRASWPDEP